MVNDRPENILTVDNLVVDIPTPAGVLHAVRDVSFGLKKGRTLGIVGESGCGKSVTVMAIIGLLSKKIRVTAEQLKFSDMDLLGLSGRKFADIRGEHISMIFQEPMTALNPVYTIGEQLTEGYLRHRSATKANARNKALRLLDRVGISSAERRLNQYPHELSGGLRQRVMIAMALMCDPDIIIADEPTTALDVTIQAQILSLLSELQKETGTAMIIVSHDLGVISRVADHVLVMYAGRIVESGTAEQIFATPTHPYTQGLFSCIPVPGKTPKGSMLGSIPGVVPSLIGDLKGCMFRPRCDLASDRCLAQIPAVNFPVQHHVWCVAPVEELKERSEKVMLF
ncbi:MAG: ABC transporter ATP-binding protein [Proteobacteria bacterium]|nr:ABC transporter ATP-binding protein [Pseudomonadota bacterium]